MESEQIERLSELKEKIIGSEMQDGPKLEGDEIRIPEPSETDPTAIPERTSDDPIVTGEEELPEDFERLFQR